MSRVVIIGGGAAGMAAAVSAAMCGDQVTILERMDRVGKKLLATGNGRCNLMNTGDWRFPGGAPLAQEVLSRCGAEEQRLFWEHLGLRLREEDGGRVYPVSGQASTVLDCLRLALNSLQVEIVTGVQAESIVREKRRWMVTAASQCWHADRVIVCGGGCSQPKLGSNGSTWALLEALGHRLVSPRPVLTQIETDTAPIRGLSGIRVRCELRVLSGDKEVHSERGEALFADYGVSGVCAMQCARYVRPGTVLSIDFLRGMDFDSPAELRRELQRRHDLWAGQPAEMLLTGLCVPRLALALLSVAGIDKRVSCGQIPPRLLERLAALMSDFRLSVRGVKGFDSSQVTAGGISWKEFDPGCMESRLQKGIHAAGEMLDVDGDCGGFNLMFAFGSGILAGLNGRKAPWRFE